MTTLRYATALPILAAHGLAPGPEGFAPTDLVAVAAARGWTAHAEPVGWIRGRPRWRASVWGASAYAGGTVQGTSARGASEDEALAVALASMLRRAG